MYSVNGACNRDGRGEKGAGWGWNRMEAVDEIQRFMNILTFLYDGLANIYFGSLIVQISRYRWCRQLTPILQHRKGRADFRQR